MKRIFFGGKSTSFVHFWKPWGFPGCLGRLLLFLLMLLLLICILSCFERYHGGFVVANDVYDDPVAAPVVEYPNDPDWNQPVDGGEEVGLPAPGENHLPPFEEMDPIQNPDDEGSQIYPNLLYVIFNSDVNDESYKTFARAFTSLYPEPGSRIEYYNTSSKTAVLYVPAEQRQQICRDLPEQISEVEFMVVPVEVMTQGQASVPNDPVFKYSRLSWYFKPIQAFEAWQITQGSPDIIVGIVDSYMDLTHEELKGDRILFPFSVLKQNSDVTPRRGAPKDYWGHGSLVTSVAVGNANNNKGSSGIAPKCKFIPVSLGENLNTVTEVEGILYCIYHGANVVNVSCGKCYTDEEKAMSLDEQIRYSEHVGLEAEKMWDYVFKIADERNVTIVWASGNEDVFCAMDRSKRNATTIKVSAVDRDLRKADFSNFGNFKNRGLFESTISAPGVEIFGATPNNSYDSWDGTSFSAPIITGVVALMKSLNANLTNQEIIRILQETGKPVNGAPEIGKLVQIKDALMKVKSMVPKFTTDIETLKGVWEETTLTRISDSKTGNFTGKSAKIRLHIKDSKTGTVIFVVSDGSEYKSPAKISISTDHVLVTQLSNATCPEKDDYMCKVILKLMPDRQGFMKCIRINDSGEVMAETNMRKIS